MVPYSYLGEESELPWIVVFYPIIFNEDEGDRRCISRLAVGLGRTFQGLDDIYIFRRKGIGHGNVWYAYMPARFWHKSYA